MPDTMTTPIVTNALIDTIKSAGFNIGHAQVYDLKTRRPVWHIDATDVETGESWIVHAPTLYEAARELAAGLLGGAPAEPSDRWT